MVTNMDLKSKRKPKMACQNCGRKISKTQFKQHSAACCKRKKDLEKPFICTEDDCKKAFKSQQYLAHHVWNVHSKAVKCPYKNCVAVLKKACLSAHIRQVHEKLKQTCDNCGKSYTYGCLTQHLTRCLSDGSKPYKCTEKGCNKSFKTLQDRIRHEKIVHSAPVNCPYPNCEAMLKKSCLSLHVKLMHEHRRVECPNCGKNISYGNKIHFKTCTSDGSRPYKCLEKGCDKIFRTIHERWSHRYAVHRGTVECPVANCGAVFKRSSLPRHMKAVHENVKEECNNCGKQVSFGTLTSHVKRCTSDGSKNFKCTEPGCAKAFTSSLYRSKHITRVHSEPIECPYPGCDSVIKKACLNSHIKIVHKKMKQQCDNCGKKVVHGNLKPHVLTCTSDGSRLFECTDEDCKKTFRTAGARKQHERKSHSERIECPFPKCGAMVKRVCLPGHVRLVHDKMKEVCPECDKKVPYGTLKKHLKACTSDGSKIFACTAEGCDKKFMTTANRSSHVWVVHSEPIECPFPKCKAVMKRGSLPVHVRNVHDKMKEQCSKCGVKVVYGSLSQHAKYCVGFKEEVPKKVLRSSTRRVE